MITLTNYQIECIKKYGILLKANKVDEFFQEMAENEAKNEDANLFAYMYETIPDFLTYITEIIPHGFYGVILDALRVPDNVKKLRRESFDHCVIDVLKLSDGITEIPELAFKDCAITSLFLPKNLEIIEDHAFAFLGRCRKLYIPDTVTTIGFDTFKGCNSLVLQYNKDNTDLGNRLHYYCEYDIDRIEGI